MKKKFKGSLMHLQPKPENYNSKHVFQRSFNIAVLASTRGTDLQAIIDEIKKGSLKVDLKVVLSNKKNCYALERARKQGFKAIFVNPLGKSKNAYDHTLIEILQKYDIDLV